MNWLGVFIALLITPLSLETQASSKFFTYNYGSAPLSKQVIGTAYEPSGSASPLWFTLTGGIITEIFYPTINQPQVGELQFIVTDGKNIYSEQYRDTDSQVRYQDEGLVVQVTGKDRNWNYTYSQEIFSDTASPVLRIRTHFEWLKPGLKVFLVFKPTIQGKKDHTFGEVHSWGFLAGAITAKENETVFASLIASTPWKQSSVESEGTFFDLFGEHRKRQIEGGPGKIFLLGELQNNQESRFTYELALGFGPSPSAALTYAKTAMNASFDQAAEIYSNGWRNYLEALNFGNNKSRFIKENIFARRSAQLIKMHEDKRNRGAFASALIAPKARVRDTYHGALGLLAAGDTTTPLDALHYLAQSQRDDGSWNSDLLNSKSEHAQIALDEIALPILLAGNLYRHGLIRPKNLELEMVRKCASFIILHGPATNVDRWDSTSGLVPSILAIEIAALRTATELTGETLPAMIADLWQSEVERWTLVQQSPLGKNYYLRAQPALSHNGEPSQRVLDLNQSFKNLGPLAPEELIDGGFLDLVRYGIRDPRDTRILNTLRLYDHPLLGISSGLHYRRHNLDHTGTALKEGVFPVLAGERGIYAIAAGDFERARAELHALEISANENGLIPEKLLKNTNAVTPLMWAHSEDILLHSSLEEGSVFDQPNNHSSH